MDLTPDDEVAEARIWRAAYDELFTTTLAGRVAFVEREAVRLGLDISAAIVTASGAVKVHLRKPRASVADAEQLMFACGVEVWDVSQHHYGGEPFVAVEGRASPSLNVRVLCYEMEPAT